MVTFEQALQWTKKYSNVKMVDHHGTQFRVEIRDPDGHLIWREWNFEECSELIKCVQQYGIEHQLFAHILKTQVIGIPMVYVVITLDFVLEPNKNYTAIMVESDTAAMELALKRNAIIVTPDGATQ